MNEMLFYRCEKCGNIVTSIKSLGDTLTCCGQAMTKLTANSTDAAKEKHVPVLAIEGGKVKVTVGSVAHPMTAEHFIEWIALETDTKFEIVHLKPGMEPKANFTYYYEEDKIIFVGKDDEIIPNCEANACNFEFDNKTEERITVYAFCNLHGLWKTEI